MRGSGWLALLLGMVVAAPAQAQDSATARLQALAERFWTWRAATQPASGDDIPRIERPPGWTPDWSPAAMAARRETLHELERDWRGIDTTGWSRPAQVDYRLLGSAIARVHWELDIVRGWRRNPMFYLDQTLSVLHDDLLRAPPFDPARTSAMVHRLERVPPTLAEGEANLTEAVGPFAQLAVGALDG
ncbi:MAG TPA: hypothetical protein VEU27_05460, partial [Gemmatimonadales bacterium]|nr:hypothetical protein [Gemmatimonadales bacterium]